MRRHDYLERILTSRVYDVATESPLEPAAALGKRLGNTLLLAGLGGFPMAADVADVFHRGGDSDYFARFA